MKTGLMPRAELELDGFTPDPYCKLYLPLWKLDGDSFMSKDTYGHLCTNHGSLWTPQGRSFDGVDDYVDCGSEASLNINNNFTIEAWIKLTAGQTEGVVNWGEQTAGKRRGMFVWNKGSGTNWRLWFSGYGAAANVGGTSNLNDGKWHHAVVTVDSNNHGKVYVDRVLENEKDLTLVSYSFSGTRIGRTDSLEYFKGLIAEVRIYSRVLTPQEILDHYLVGKEMFG